MYNANKREKEGEGREGLVPRVILGKRTNAYIQRIELERLQITGQTQYKQKELD